MPGSPRQSQTISVFSWKYLLGCLHSIIWRRNDPEPILAGILDDRDERSENRDNKQGDKDLLIQKAVSLLSTDTLEPLQALQAKKNIVKRLHFLGDGASLGQKEDALLPIQPPRPEDVIHDLLIPRREALQDSHPNKISALADAYLTLISLCLSPESAAQTSGPIYQPVSKLSPLYGCNPTETGSIRRVDGQGMLLPDCFVERRVACLQPAVSALLLLWNRNHNYIAHSIFIRFSALKKWKMYPDTSVKLDTLSSRAAIKSQDDEIFEAAMKINCIQFRNTICEDVLKGLLGRDEFDPSLEIDFLADIPSRPKGQPIISKICGRSEVKLLYPLNPMLSQADGRIIEDYFQGAAETDNLSTAYQKCTGSTQMSDMTADSRYAVNYTWLHKMSGSSSASGANSDRSVLQRNAKTGLYHDEDIAAIVKEARMGDASPPGSGLTSPKYMRIIDNDALEAENKLRTCTFNEFRVLYGLQPLTSFAAWNPDRDVGSAAQRLYGRIDNLGLYAGLQCEAPASATDGDSEIVPQAGFGFGPTKTYALLVDLVTRIRSEPPIILQASISRQDRDPDDPLRQWIEKETTMNWSLWVNGQFFARVLQRNLPDHFPFNNINSHFLFSSRVDAQDAAVKRHTGAHLTAGRLYWPRIHVLDDMAMCQKVFKSVKAFKTMYHEQLKILTNGYGYLLGFDDQPLHEKDRQMTMFALVPDTSGSLHRYGYYFGRLTAEYIEKYSKRLRNDTFRIDIVEDVINNVCTRWVCEILCDYELSEDNPSSANQAGGDLPAKTTQQMYQEFANLSTYIFKMHRHDDPYEAQRRAISSSDYLRRHIQRQIPAPDWLSRNLTFSEQWKDLVNSIKCGFLDLIVVWFQGKRLPTRTAQTFLRRVVQANRLIRLPKDNLVALMTEKIQAMKDAGHQITSEVVDKVEGEIEASRAVANILGLAAVTAVNLPQVCSIVVDFYLQPEQAEAFKEIADLSRSFFELTEVADRYRQDADNLKNRIKHKVAVYVLHAMRSNMPLALWRRCDSNIKLGQNFQVQKGDLIFADLKHIRRPKSEVSGTSTARNQSGEHLDDVRERVPPEITGQTDETGHTHDLPETTDVPDGETEKFAEAGSEPDERSSDDDDSEDTSESSNSEDSSSESGESSGDSFEGIAPVMQPRDMFEYLLGMGAHQCPALTRNPESSFIDEVIPEVIMAIFRLEKLKCVGRLGLQGVDARPHSTLMDPKVYIGPRGEVSFYPQTLLLEFEGQPPSSHPNDTGLQDTRVFPATRQRVAIRITEYMLAFMSLLWLAYRISVILLSMWALVMLHVGPTPRIRQPAYIPTIPEVQVSHVECSPPFAPWESWTPYTLADGPGQTPSDVIYNSSVPLAHQLHIYDADKKDTKLAIYVDDVLRALTGDFELDRSIDCGIDVYQCYAHQFSSGSIVVPPGAHTIRISWAGKELINGTYPDLGKDKSRRVLIKRDYCAAPFAL